MRFAALAHMILFVGAAGGQPPTAPRPARTGDVVVVAEGKFADVAVEVPAGAAVVWRFYPPPVQRADKLTPGRAIFAGKPGASYLVTAVVIDFAKKTVTDTEFEVRFAGKTDPPPPPDPAPEPKPKPDPKPDPPPDPKPAPAKTVRVILVYESGATVSAKHFGVLYGKELEEFVAGRCGPTGWGRRDKDADPAHDSTPLRATWAAGKPLVPAVGVPAVVVDADGKVTADPLPLSAAEAIGLIRKRTGDN